MPRTNRRKTLSTLSSNTLNMRSSLGASGNRGAGKKKRMSMAPGGERKGRMSRRSLAPGMGSGKGMQTPVRHSLGSSAGMGGGGGEYGMGGRTPGSAKKKRLSLNPSGSSWRATIKNDPRPYRDKKFQNRAIHMLVTYLAHHGFDGETAVAAWARPSVTNFSHTFKYLYSGFDPYYKFSSQRFDAEVADLFNTLGYPFKISKSSLASVGSGHTWPTVLAALSWMIKLLTYEEEVLHLEDELGMEIEDEASLFFEYMHKCYNAFLAGADEFETFELELAAMFDDRNAALIEQIQTARTNIETMNGRITSLSTGSPIDELRTRKTELKDDLNKFALLATKLSDHEAQMIAMRDQADEHKAAKVNELAHVREQKNALQLAIQAQPMSTEDVSRMNKERVALEVSLEELQASREAADSEMWDKEVALSKASEELASLVASVSARVADLTSSPLADSDSFPRDLVASLDLAFNPNGSTEEDLVSVAPSQIEDKVSGLRSAFAALAHELQGAALQTKERKEVQEEKVAEKRAIVSALEAKINKVELQCNYESEAAVRTQTQLSAETAKIEEATLSLRASNSASVQSSAEHLAALQTAYTDLIERCEMEKNALENCIIGSLDMLTHHKILIQQTFDNVSDVWQATIEDVANMVAHSMN